MDHSDICFIHRSAVLLQRPHCAHQKCSLSWGEARLPIDKKKKSVTMQRPDKSWTLFTLWRWQTGQKGGMGLWWWWEGGCKSGWGLGVELFTNHKRMMSRGISIWAPGGRRPQLWESWGQNIPGLNVASMERRCERAAGQTASVWSRTRVPARLQDQPDGRVFTTDSFNWTPAGPADTTAATMKYFATVLFCPSRFSEAAVEEKVEHRKLRVRP